MIPDAGYQIPGMRFGIWDSKYIGSLQIISNQKVPPLASSLPRKRLGEVLV
jgi:hypothetical protein